MNTPSLFQDFSLSRNCNFSVYFGKSLKQRYVWVLQLKDSIQQAAEPLYWPAVQRAVLLPFPFSFPCPYFSIFTGCAHMIVPFPWASSDSRELIFCTELFFCQFSVNWLTLTRYVWELVLGCSRNIGIKQEGGSRSFWQQCVVEWHRSFHWPLPRVCRLYFEESLWINITATHWFKI